jgi:uncharacterized protein (DUF1697 family)
MTTYVAFLRAINVAGHATVRMTDLRDVFAAAGCQGVRTYIQSGNVLFDAPKGTAAAVFERVLCRLRELLGHEPGIMFRTAREIEQLVASDPFQGYRAEPDVKLYVAFLSQKAPTTPRFPWHLPAESLEAIGMKGREVFVVSRRKKNGFYGFPNNFIEKELGVSATSRNWNTLTKLAAFARAEAGD